MRQAYRKLWLIIDLPSSQYRLVEQSRPDLLLATISGVTRFVLASVTILIAAFNIVHSQLSLPTIALRLRVSFVLTVAWLICLETLMLGITWAATLLLESLKVVTI